MSLNNQEYLTVQESVQAVKLDSTNAEDIAVWCGGEAVPDGVRIPTLAGILTASLTQYVVRDGKKGTFFVMEEEKFLAKYQVEELPPVDPPIEE